jgi:deoxyinosine 3'endonuclease (endonuclease V)
LTGYRLPGTPAEAVRQQKEIAEKVITKDVHGRIKLVCGVDVSYRQDIAHCSVVVTDMDERCRAKKHEKQGKAPVHTRAFHPARGRTGIAHDKES